MNTAEGLASVPEYTETATEAEERDSEERRLDKKSKVYGTDSPGAFAASSRRVVLKVVMRQTAQ
jgi:hypothetical protein